MFEASVPSFSRALTAFAVVCGVALCAVPARAQALGPTLLAYHAPPECPAVGDFQRSVERRSSRIHFVDEGSHDRQLAISLTKERDFTVGELRLIERDGTLRQRSVRFGSCAEAVDGLALIATVSLDPQALLQARPAQGRPEAQAKTAPTKAPVPTPAASSPMVPSAASQTSELEVDLGAEFAAYSHALPALAIGGGAFLELGSTSRHLFSPFLRGAIVHVERLRVAEANGTANFALTLVTLTGCPLRLGAGVLTLRPCLFANGGTLRAWGSETEDPQSRTRQYWSWGASGLLSLQLGEVVEIVGDAGVGVALIRDRFVFGSGEEFWETPALYVSSGIGVGLRLP